MPNFQCSFFEQWKGGLEWFNGVEFREYCHQEITKYYRYCENKYGSYRNIRRKRFHKNLGFSWEVKCECGESFELLNLKIYFKILQNDSCRIFSFLNFHKTICKNMVLILSKEHKNQFTPWKKKKKVVKYLKYKYLKEFTIFLNLIVCGFGV